jgi:hypothetical protein
MNTLPSPRPSTLLAALAILTSLGIAACGNSEPAMMGNGGTGGGGGGGPGGGGGGDIRPFLPLQTGNTWTYLVTDATGVPTPKTQTVMGQEPVGGTGPNAATTAFRMVTRKGVGGLDETVSWQARVGTRVVRYREQSFMATAPHGLEIEEHWAPSKLRVDETPAHTVAGASWLETDQETKLPVGGTPTTLEVREVWNVTAERQAVTVQGQSYEVMIVTKSGGAQKTYWWARGIGKVKEIGSNQTEELMSYQVAP